MKKHFTPITAFIASGFIANAFSGFINPIYITHILANLDGRVIVLGSLMSSGLPVLVGLALERRAILDRLYAILPVVMVAEIVLTAASTAVAAIDLTAYYLIGMLLFGLLTNSVVYLQQRLKETTVRRNRAAFDRRMAVADGLGYLTGSALGLVGIATSVGPTLVGVLGAVQTAAVYGLLVFVYRKVPHRRRARRAPVEKPPQHLWMALPCPDAA